jgi:hypothetical protein
VHGAAKATGAADGASADFTQHLNRIGAECQRMAVAAIGAGDDVIRIERARDTDRHGLLAIAEVRAAPNHAVSEEFLDASFDGANFDHSLQLLDTIGERGAACSRHVGIENGHDACFHQACGARPVETSASICCVT